MKYQIRLIIRDSDGEKIGSDGVFSDLGAARREMYANTLAELVDWNDNDSVKPSERMRLQYALDSSTCIYSNFESGISTKREIIILPD